MKEKIEREFQKLCRLEKRKGVIGFAPLKEVKLLPVQRDYLKRKLAGFDFSKPITAISIGVFYTPEEIKSIPDCWIAKGTKSDNWNNYARVCGEINRTLNRISQALAEKFSGIREQATVEGYTHKVKKVEEYYDLCISHRAFAEEAGLGWRGKSGLIISPENGPALRLSTIFVPHEIKSAKRNFQGCGDCQACMQVCPFLKGQQDYRQGCLFYRFRCRGRPPCLLFLAYSSSPTVGFLFGSFARICVSVGSPDPTDYASIGSCMGSKFFK